MTSTIFSELQGRVHFYPLSVGQYHRMIREGILPEGEPYELLDGQLVRKDRNEQGNDPMTVGENHATVVRKLARWREALLPRGCWIQTQMPITLGDDSEPEPDAAIVRGREEDFDGRHPSASDVVCVVEVADSSLQRDRVTKQRLYADASIGVYLIINLADRVVEFHDQPQPGTGRYARCVTLHPDSHITLPLGVDLFTVPVTDVLT